MALFRVASLSEITQISLTKLIFLKAQARALFYIFDGIFWHPRSAAKMLRFSIHCILISWISLLRTAAFDLRCTIIYFD